jgi:hypothetical protein
MPEARSTPGQGAARVSSRHIEIGRRVADQHPQARVGYISGSILDGFGTPRSDLDVFLLTDGEPATSAMPAQSDAPLATYQANGYLIELDYAEDIPTDTEIWPIDVVVKLPEEFAAIDLEDWSAAGAVSEGKLNLAHRLRIGLPVVGHDRFYVLRDQFDWHRLARIIRNRFLASYNNLADDAVGVIEIEDAMSAVLASRLALGAAVDALTAAKGHTNPKEKWRWRKLVALGLDEVAASYRMAELDPDPDHAALLARSQARLRLASAFAIQATLESPQS